MRDIQRDSQCLRNNEDSYPLQIGRSIMALFVRLVLVVFCVLSGVTCASAAQPRDQFVIGEKYTIHSSALNEDRSIWVSLPDSYAASKAYRRYPILVVLDGNTFFHQFTGVVRQLSTDATPLIPEMIVVGINSTDRVRDSTPTRSLVGPDGLASQDWARSGGGAQFQKFLKEDVVPFIDRNFSTDGYRILAGYSLTGVPVLYHLFAGPNAFNAYLSLDASIWWDNFLMMRLATQAHLTKTFDHRQLFLLTTAQKYPAPYISVEPGGRELTALLATDPIPGLVVSHLEVTRESHHSLATIGLYEGLARIFDGHMMTLDELYLHPETIPDRFANLSARLGHRFAPPEGVVDYFGQFFLRARPKPEMTKALAYFRINTIYYPQSPNAWVALGEALTETNQCEEASRALHRGLQLQPDLERAKVALVRTDGAGGLIRPECQPHPQH